MPRKPKVNADAEKELRRIDEELLAKQEQLRKFNLEEMDKAPIKETEDQTKMTKKQIETYDAPVIKPVRSIGTKESPNPSFAEKRKKDWELVKCVVENNEIIGERVELWTKPYPGDNADFWLLPVNKPIYIPRHLARQLSRCMYHRLMMEENEQQITGTDGVGTYIGKMMVQETRHRIKCTAVNNNFEFTAPEIRKIG